MHDWLIVGAGFAGSVLAERIASVRGETVHVIDRRDHIAGNAYDTHDSSGILIHKYGPHIFHTNSVRIVDYLSRFTGWRPYEHRVLASVADKLVPFPINIDTLNALYGLSLRSGEEMQAFLDTRKEDIASIETSEDVVLAAVGRDLYETFFQGYTRKQWGLDPSELSRQVTARIPTRLDHDDRYFTDRFQRMPAEGYTRMFERMLDHPLIEVSLGTDFSDLRDTRAWRNLIFTGPIDEYFGHVYGRLPYRSLRFRHVQLDTEWHQPVAVVNYPGAEPYTRITEYKHMTGQKHPRTSITYEYPTDVGDPYYPIPRPENQALLRRYEALAERLDRVWFAGRLGSYRYFNMDQVVGQALATFEKIEAAQPVERAPAARAGSVLGAGT